LIQDLIGGTPVSRCTLVDQGMDAGVCGKIAWAPLSPEITSSHMMHDARGSPSGVRAIDVLP
jgi:hypothetical protein